MVPESSGGQPDTQVDLFPSHESAHLPVYFHIQEGQESRGINALVQRWKFKKKYAFPFPQLILYKYAWQSRSEWCDRYDVSKTRPSVVSLTK